MAYRPSAYPAIIQTDTAIHDTITTTVRKKQQVNGTLCDRSKQHSPGSCSLIDVPLCPKDQQSLFHFLPRSNLAAQTLAGRGEESITTGGQSAVTSPSFSFRTLVQSGTQIPGKHAGGRFSSSATTLTAGAHSATPRSR